MNVSSVRSRAFRAAILTEFTNTPNSSGHSSDKPLRILVVDLNNFVSFPTLAIGILVGALRNHSHEVRVLCPLAHDVPAAERERRERWIDNVKRRIHLTEAPGFRIARDMARTAYYSWMELPHRGVLRAVERAMEKPTDIVVLSAYFQHINTVRRIGRLGLKKGIPVLLGGPMFNNAAATEVWRQIPGLAGVVGAEADLNIGEIVKAAHRGTGLEAFDGVTLPDGQRTRPAPPLRDLDQTPMADFSDFPWDRYRQRVVPMMAGRGCQWDKCTFCSDVVTVSGRTFRTRSVQNVLLEMEEQARRCSTTSFVFLDLKLNSYPDMIRGIASEIQRHVYGAEWIGTVHVDLRKDNGLSRTDLKAAAQGGMRRINFGLETGSQTLLDRMHKGTSVERNAEFIRDAYDAGLSIRCSMFKGYPGETVDDLDKSVSFLEKHGKWIDRIRFSDFSLLDGTPVESDARASDKTGGNLRIIRHLDPKARSEYVLKKADQRAYSRSLNKLLGMVYEINRRQLRPSARQFDGLM